MIFDYCRLGYEATKALSTAPRVVKTPLGLEHEGSTVSDNVAIIPILRAGLAMTDGILELMPNAAVYHIGKSIKDVSHNSNVDDITMLAYIYY